MLKEKKNINSLDAIEKMKYPTRLHVLLATLLLFSGLLQAQKVTVTARMDSTTLWIGDQSGLSFEVTQASEQEVSFPLFFDSIPGGLEIVGTVQTDSLRSKDGYLTVTQRYTVTAFEDSLYYIPAQPFIIGGDTLWSNPLSLKVIQPFEIDTASHAITDIKPIYKARFDWKWFFKMLLLVILITALCVLAYFIIRKFFRKPGSAMDLPEVKSSLPPHVIALAALDKIKEEKPWQQGLNKEYHTDLTDVLREYIERMFNIPSMEMTSDEILDGLSNLQVSQKSAHNSLKQILQLADLVKFAKWNPATEENELSLLNAYLFVNQTKVEELSPNETEINKKDNKN